MQSESSVTGVVAVGSMHLGSSDGKRQRYLRPKTSDNCISLRSRESKPASLTPLCLLRRRIDVSAGCLPCSGFPRREPIQKPSLNASCHIRMTPILLYCPLVLCLCSAMSFSSRVSAVALAPAAPRSISKRYISSCILPIMQLSVSKLSFQRLMANMLYRAGSSLRSSISEYSELGAPGFDRR